MKFLIFKSYQEKFRYKTKKWNHCIGDWYWKFTDILNYKESSQPPDKFVQFNPISDLPSSIKDISYSVKNFNKIPELEKLLLSYKSDIVKEYLYFWLLQ